MVAALQVELANMALRTSLRQLIGAVDDISVDLAMAEALATADAHSLRLVVDALLKRGRPEGACALIEHYHTLPSDVCHTVIDRLGDLYRPMRLAAGKRHTHGPSNVVAIVRQAHAAKLAYLVSDQLVHGAEPLRKEAAQCLLELAQWCRSTPTAILPTPRSPCDGQMAAYIQDAVQEALGAYDSHGQEQILLALAVLTPRVMPKAADILARVKSQAADRLRQMFRRSDDPDICRALITFITHPALGDDVLIGLKKAIHSPLAADMLASAHLLLDRSATKPLQSVKNLAGLLPNRDTLCAIPDHRRLALLWWLDALPLAHHQRVEQLTHLACLGTPLPPALPAAPTPPAARLAVLRRLMKLSRGQQISGAAKTISQFCFDDEQALARIALAHLIDVQWRQLPQLLVRLVSSRHYQIRTTALIHLAPLGFERFWQAWPRLDGRQRLYCGTALIKIDTLFHSQLAKRLAAADLTTKLRTLAIIGELNQGDLFEQALIQLTRHEDKRIVASAVRALTAVHSPGAIRTLDHALQHGDSRVRANAVEALHEAQAPDHINRLLTMAHHEDNRPRANAINQLLQMRTADALKALNTMLCDDRPKHRTSALWLVQSAGLIQVATHVAELSISDPNPDVKKRAEKTVQLLIDSMRSPTPLQASGLLEPTG